MTTLHEAREDELEQIIDDTGIRSPYDKMTNPKIQEI